VLIIGILFHFDHLIYFDLNATYVGRGSWGRGGFFSALSRSSPSIASAYELAGEMDDLQLGQAHLIDIGVIEQRQTFVALLITQSRNKEGTTVSGTCVYSSIPD
jgi:hypothetical protein